MRGDVAEVDRADTCWAPRAASSWASCAVAFGP